MSCSTPPSSGATLSWPPSDEPIAYGDPTSSGAGVPKGRLLPVSRDDLLECAALLRSVRRGDD